METCETTAAPAAVPIETIHTIQSVRQRIKDLQRDLRLLEGELDEFKPNNIRSTNKIDHRLSDIEDKQYLLARTAKRFARMDVVDDANDHLRMAAVRLRTMLGVGEEYLALSINASEAIFYLGVVRIIGPGERITIWKRLVKFANERGIAGTELVDVDALLASEVPRVRRRLATILEQAAAPIRRPVPLSWDEPNL